MDAAGYALGGGLPGALAVGAITRQVDPDLTKIGTVVRYGLGGGMDTYTFKDGGKSYRFSDGDEIVTDKNGKFLGSFSTDWP